MLWINKKGQPIAIKGTPVDCDECFCDPCFKNDCIFTPVFSSVFHMKRYGGLISSYQDIDSVTINGNIVLPMNWNSTGDGGYNPLNGDDWVAESRFYKKENDKTHLVTLKVSCSRTPEDIRLSETGSIQSLYRNRYDLYYYLYENDELVRAEGKSYTARYYSVSMTDKAVTVSGFSRVAGVSAFPGTEVVIPFGDNTKGKYDLRDMVDQGKYHVEEPDFLYFDRTRVGINYGIATISADNYSFTFQNAEDFDVGIYTPTIEGCPCDDSIGQGTATGGGDDIVEEVITGGSSGQSGTSGSGSSCSSEPCEPVLADFEVNQEESTTHILIDQDVTQNMELIIDRVTIFGKDDELSFVLHDYHGTGDKIITEPGRYYFSKGDHVLLTFEVKYGEYRVIGDAQLRYRFCPVDVIDGYCVWKTYYKCQYNDDYFGFVWMPEETDFIGFFPGNTAQEAGWVDGEETFDGEYKMIASVVWNENTNWLVNGVSQNCPETPFVHDGEMCEDGCNTIKDSFGYYSSEIGVFYPSEDKIMTIGKLTLPICEGAEYAVRLYDEYGDVVAAVREGGTYVIPANKQYTLTLWTRITADDVMDVNFENEIPGFIALKICESNDILVMAANQTNLLADMGE